MTDIFFQTCIRCVAKAMQLTLLLLTIAIAPPAFAQEPRIVVISTSKNPSVPALTREQVADIFLGRADTNTRWRPIDSNDEALRNQFYQSVAGISANRARAQWARLVFSARLTPPREMSPENSLKTVTAEDSAILYLFREQAPKGARILLALP